MRLYVPPTQQQGYYRYDPTHLVNRGPARIFPYAGEDGVVRFVLTKLRRNLLAQGRLSQPWSLLLEHIEQVDKWVDEHLFLATTALVDLKIFQSGWFNIELPPDEQFDASFVELRRVIGTDLRAARTAVSAAGTDKAKARSCFYQALESVGRSRPVVSRVFERDGELSDREFARQRLAGQNPMVLRRLKADDPLQPVMPTWATRPCALASGEGLDLSQAAAEQRLFVATYELLDSLTPADLQPGRYVGSPKALFYRTDAGLEPILIEVEPGQVITPATGADAWMRAKLWVQTADVTRHALIDHLCDTHLRMEAFAIATPRQLPPTHPVYRLLRPHFRFLLAINTRGNTILLGEGAAIDKLMAPTLEASIALINRAYESPFEFQALPNNITRRGIEPEFLPDFPYRDDALLLWEAINRYVSHFLHSYYPDDQAVERDTYLQAWAAELGEPLDGRSPQEFPQAPAWMPAEWVKEAGLVIEHMPSHARVPDFPTSIAGQTLGRIKGLEQLIEVLTQVIFTCGPQHAAVNFSQFDYVGYTPNAPLALYHRPQDPVPLDSMLPTVEQEIGQMELTICLSGIRWGNLGSSDLIQFTNLVDQQCLHQFQADLAAIEAKITARNHQRLAEDGVEYPYLLPSLIPNSINI